MLTAKVILERLDKEHRLLEKRELPSRSFLKNFISLLYIYHAQLGLGDPYSMPDITNTARDIDVYNATGRAARGNLKVGSPPGSSAVFCPVSTASILGWLLGELCGIVVGTGTNAVTPTDYALQTRVAHGRGAGQLEYGGCELIGIAFADPNGEFTIRRYFTNASGGSITINECGIYAAGCGQSFAAWPFCIARDLVAPGVAVANGELLRATYVPQITV